MRGLKKVCVVCVFISMFVCPSCVIPQSSRTLRLVCSMCAAPNSATANLSSSSSSSRLLQRFSPSLLNLPLSIPPLAILTLSQSRLSPPCTSSSSSSSLSFALSPTFSPIHILILVSFTPSSPLCPSPSLLIRAICWRGRQGDLRMDRIVVVCGECGTVL